MNMQEDNDEDAEQRGPGEPSTSGRANGASASNGGFVLIPSLHLMCTMTMIPVEFTRP